MQFHFNEKTCHPLISIETLFTILEIAIYPNFYFYSLNCLSGQLDWLLSLDEREIKFCGKEIVLYSTYHKTFTKMHFSH